MKESGELYLTFSAGETLPKEGDTVIMSGFATWRVTIRKIYGSTYNQKTGNTMLRVSASRELIEEAQSA